MLFDYNIFFEHIVLGCIKLRKYILTMIAIQEKQQLGLQFLNLCIKELDYLLFNALMHRKGDQGNFQIQQQCEFGFLQNPFKKTNSLSALVKSDQTICHDNMVKSILIFSRQNAGKKECHFRQDSTPLSHPLHCVRYLN